MARGNYILYALEAVLGATALLTFTASGQMYLEVLLLIVLVASALHGVVAAITLCGNRKWIMVGLNAAIAITAIIMLILNLNTDKDNATTPPTVAVDWPWKVALCVIIVITVLGNLALVGDGSQWRCSEGLKCVNPGDLDAVITAAKKYNNAYRGESKLVSGPLSNLGKDKISLNDLKDDTLETTKIAYITVDQNGKDLIDCKNFKGAIDKITSDTNTAKRKSQAEERKKVSFEALNQKQADADKLAGEFTKIPRQYPVVQAPPPPAPFKQQLAQQAKARALKIEPDLSAANRADQEWQAQL